MRPRNARGPPGTRSGTRPTHALRHKSSTNSQILEKLLPASARLPAPALGAQREHRRGRHAQAAACRATSTGTSRLVFEYAHRLAASAAEILERLLLTASANPLSSRARPAALHRRGPRGSSSSTRVASRRAPPRSSSGCSQLRRDFQLPRSARSENIVAVDTLRRRPAALHRRGPRGSSSSTRVASRRAPPRSSSGCSQLRRDFQAKLGNTNNTNPTTTYITCPNPKCPQGFKLATSKASQALAYFGHHLSCRPLPKSARFAVKHC